MADVLARITRISDNYLQEMEEAQEPQGPPKPTKAQKKAAKKEAKLQAKFEEKRLIMRDALMRELEMGKRMEEKGNEEWHEMCREIKIRELNEEMVAWGERAERNILAKNDHIKMLLDDMAQTQDQHVRSYSKTVELIDHIRDCFHVMLGGEVRRRTEELEAMHTHSDNIIHATNITTRDQIKEDYTIYLEQRDDRVNTEIENRFKIRDQIVRRMTHMQRQLNDFVESLRSTELDAHKYEKIHWLTERQEAFMEESHKLNAEESKYINMQAELQREMLRMDIENNSTLNDLRLEFQYFTNVRKKIELNQEMDRNITHEKLRILTGECYELTKEMEKHVKSGELLLALSITCRKLQTEAEKVILGGEVFDDTELQVEENFKLQTLNLKDHVDMTEEELVELNKSLKNFWRRQAVAEAQNLLMLEEKRRLTEDNQRLIDFLKSKTVTEDPEELRTAMHVSSPTQPMPPKVFDSKCHESRARKVLKSPTAHKEAKFESEAVLKEVILEYS
ncbi:hypothetical protein M5D96_006779 [Drosophila gunungcola]|uniref:Dynein regulatory complex subunit 2 n=1 Tax=Drosophila gunungcola TaxID=103775 RepID=A0A9Q0BQU3_9MUSC|nr:hypothetical protein M5D96_006779 [Drosophila gunungcola]